MSTWILTDPDNSRSVLYDSVTETAFGHGFIGRDCQGQAEEFLAWCPCDPRALTEAELDEVLDGFRRRPNCDDVLRKYSGRDQEIRKLAARFLR